MKIKIHRDENQTEGDETEALDLKHRPASVGGAQNTDTPSRHDYQCRVSGQSVPGCAVQAIG